MCRSEESAPGNKFLPSDDELVGYYLFHKICGRELSDVEKKHVREYDLYGEEEPSSIWKKFDGKDHQDLYIITKLKRSTKKNGEVNSRVIRKVGVNGGTWHGESPPQQFPVSVAGLNHKVVAARRRFNYRNPGSDEHFLWIMIEFSCKEISDEYVVCRLRKNSRGAKVADCEKKRKGNAEITGDFIAKKQKTGNHGSSDDGLPGLSEYIMKYSVDVEELWGDSDTIAYDEMSNADETLLISDIPDDNSCIVPNYEAPQCNVEMECAVKDAEVVEEISLAYNTWSAYNGSVIQELVSSQQQQCHIEMLPNEAYVVQQAGVVV